MSKTETIKKETIDGVEYKLFINDRGFAVRVFDIDSEEVVALVNYPAEDAALAAFTKTVDKASFDENQYLMSLNGLHGLTW